MNDEIKERIKYFKHYVVDNLSLDAQDDFQKLLDYITNLQQGYDNAIKQSLADHKYASQKEDEVIELQQENERLTSLCIGHEKELRTKDIIIKQIRNEQQDYKSRCEKAIEYIKEHIQKYDIDGSIGDFDEFDMLTKPNYLLNILQGNLNDE